MNLEYLLNRARNGGAILFCGAGFSADCLNFSNSIEIGTGQALLNTLNGELQQKGHPHKFKNLQHAADEFLERMGETSLLRLLNEKYSITGITEELIEIAKFPWDRVYTTNYDNAMELAFTRAKRPYRSFNNLDKLHDVVGSGTEIIHLHGYTERWNQENFQKSCILGADSYFRLTVLEHWLNHLRIDIERAPLVVFVGFSNSDIHLSQILFNVSCTKEKIIFINSPELLEDDDLQRNQRRFGIPLNIGRLECANAIRDLLLSDAPKAPVLRSFRQSGKLEQSSDVPTVIDIENLFVFGEFNRNHLARDVLNSKQDYTIARSLLDQLLGDVNDGVNVIQITGEICDGKTIFVDYLSAKLSLGRPVYILRHVYDDILEEIVSVLGVAKNAVFVVENCFNLSENRLIGMTRIVDGSEATMILTSRSVAADAEVVENKKLEELSSFRKYRIGQLDSVEIDQLINLTDQIAAWRSFWGHTRNDRLQYISKTCNGSLPAFLLRLLRSEHVKRRYQLEFEKIATLNTTEFHTIIAALYVAHIGHDAPLSFLSNVFRYDAGELIQKLNRSKTDFRLLRRDGEYVRTVPSIGATNILREIVNSNDLVDAIISVLDNLSSFINHDDFTRYLFRQMMRYSILASVVSDPIQINRFFDNVSKIEYCRRRVLFWLQWHMAKTDQLEFAAAERYLEQGYSEAKAWEYRTGRQYDKKQLDDRRAKFLMIRGRHEEFTPNVYFQNFRDAYNIVYRLFGGEEVTHHPYETLREINRFLEVRGGTMNTKLLQTANNMLQNLVGRAQKRMQSLEGGYQTRKAKAALEELSNLDTEN